MTAEELLCGCPVDVVADTGHLPDCPAEQTEQPAEVQIPQQREPFGERPRPIPGFRVRGRRSRWGAS